MRKYMYFPLIPIVIFAMFLTSFNREVEKTGSSTPPLLLAVGEVDKVTPKSSVLEGSGPLQNSSPLVAALPQQQAGPINVPLMISATMPANVPYVPYDYVVTAGPGTNYVVPSEQFFPELPREQQTATLSSSNDRSSNSLPFNNAPMPPQVFNSAQQTSLSPN